jgi:hypothetical protein
MGGWASELVAAEKDPISRSIRGVVDTTPAAMGLDWRWFALPPDVVFRAEFPGSGFSLPIVCLAWLAIASLCISVADGTPA